MDADAPKKIGKYDVEDVIGRGGMGVVYKAVDRTLGRPVAIKMVTSAAADEGELLRRFYREAQFTANLRHPNIVVVYDMGDFEGKPYLVMEFLEGMSLEWMLANQPISLLQKLNYIRQVCNGLEYAHSRQPSIIHRDIKPANIVVLDDGTVKIVDFGVARLVNSRNTRAGQIMGSFHYMSPEQINDADLDARSDIFSTGVVLYQLLTLKFPFDGNGIGQILNSILSSPAPPLSQFLEGYPATLDDVVARALAKDREERYQSAGEFASDLFQIEEQLKASLFGGYLSRAEGLLREGDFDRARQELLNVIRIDRQYTRANDLMRQVTQGIAKTQGKQRALELRTQAEKAMQQEKSAEALNYLEQAIRLDSTNTELQSFREEVQAIRARTEKINELLTRAERAYATDDLERASHAVQEALQLEPEAVRAKSLNALIAGRVTEREKEHRTQVTAAVAQAQGLFANGQYEQAAEFLESSAREVPDEALSNLAADARRQLEDQQKQLDQLVTTAGQLLSQGKPADALTILEAHLGAYERESRFQEILAKVRERQQKGPVIDEAISAIRTLLTGGDLEAAERQLKVALRELSDVPELRQLEQDVQGQRARNVQQRMEATVLFGSRYSGPSALRNAELRDQSVMEQTTLEAKAPKPTQSNDQTPGSSVAASRPESSPGTIASSPETASLGKIPEWPDDVLKKVERQLANFLGPLAPVLVKRVAPRTNNLDELYALLAADLEQEGDRRTFLSRRNEIAWTGADQPTEPSSAPSAAMPARIAVSSELKPADVDRAAAVLARYLGPISGVLAKKAAKRADGERTLYRLLAEHVEDKMKREHFLREAGFPE